MSKLIVEGLAKSFGKKTAVKDVSFSMHNGEIVGLLGPNGAGKTTVFYMIVGFIKSGGGTILLDEEEITHLRHVQNGPAWAYPIFLRKPQYSEK